MTVKGIDVSSYQTSTFSMANIDFAMVKATEGTNYTNPKHDAQVAHARAAGAVVGHYHFARSGSVSAQVAYFLKHAKAQAGDILVLDWEDTAFSAASKDAWFSYLDTKSSLRSVLYCNKDFWLHRDTTSVCGDGLWIADPNSSAGKPGVQHSWVFHQYSISGGIDQNVANFATKAALVAWAKNAAPDPTPNNGGTVATTDTTNEEKLAGGLLAIGEIGTVNSATSSGREEHAQPYYVAKTYDQLKQQTALLVEIRDALTQAPQSLSQDQTEHARALTGDASQEG